MSNSNGKGNILFLEKILKINIFLVQGPEKENNKIDIYNKKIDMYDHILRTPHFFLGKKVLFEMGILYTND